jgi:DNA-binding beta-propeller fold protein YncE
LRLLWYGCVALLVMACPSLAGSVSYAVLHRSGSASLERVSDDGRIRTTIATNAGGYGLAVDKQGDYIVAAVSSLLRVTASGVVSTIAPTPAGSQWLGLAVDSNGDYIAVDNQRHSIWRISPDGRVISRIAAYPVQNSDEMEDVGVAVDPGGDYLVMEGNAFSAHFWRISSSGRVMPIPLHGEKMMSGSALVAEHDGSYLVVSHRDRAVFRVTAAGEVTKFASVSGQNLTGLARNPETGEVVATLNFDPALRKIGADGLSVTEFGSIGYANAIIAESGK